jgi:predicted double-glycine peptidase
VGRYDRSLCRALGLTLLLVSVCQPAELEAGPSSTSVARHSLKDLRDKYVVKQRLDYSCGAAALATLLRYYFDEPTSEAEILRLLVARLSVDEQRLRETRGFSLLDLKYAAEALGYQAAGFKLTVDDLAQLAAPVIVFIQPLDYKHFAVLRGVAGGRSVLLLPQLKGFYESALRLKRGPRARPAHDHRRRILDQDQAGHEADPPGVDWVGAAANQAANLRGGRNGGRHPAPPAVKAASMPSGERHVNHQGAEDAARRPSPNPSAPHHFAARSLRPDDSSPVLQRAASGVGEGVARAVLAGLWLRQITGAL